MIYYVLECSECDAAIKSPHDVADVQRKARGAGWSILFRHGRPDYAVCPACMKANAEEATAQKETALGAS